MAEVKAITGRAELVAVTLRAGSRGFVFRSHSGDTVRCGPENTLPVDLSPDDAETCAAWLANWRRSDQRGWTSATPT